ncbi:MAG TPA: TonB-dependent receptor [Opitutaceae bacterium]|nr:TonB-dependent receptor [Opitutaceae bacterium]
MKRHPLLPVLVVLCGGLPVRLAAVQAPLYMAPEIVTATRIPQPAEQSAATVRAFEYLVLRDPPSLTLDGLLRSAPAFTLFRRSDSLTANPTAQGVSLRGLGPSGASRSLVLLDGVPLNDPFGGWVAWTKVPRLNLQQVEVVPGGGASAWGNAALGGVVQVLTRSSEARSTQASAAFGDYGTRSFEFAHTQPAGPATFGLAGRAFATDGFSLVAPERRGPIDIAAWSRHRWLSLRGHQPVSETLELSAVFRGYEENRGNGTPYQQNQSREKFGSVKLAGGPTAQFGWSALAYAQDQSFASTFSGVNATRTAETPASDQFDVPATAFGGSWVGTWKHADKARTSAGVDARFVRGETRENFTFAAGNFTRQRIAGGRQAMAGVFALHERPLADAWRATLGARVDTWRDTEGHRRETDRVTGAVLRNDRYADQDGVAFSPSAGLVWQPEETVRVRANAQRSYRRPTLNELYRPFRVGANVTEANPALQSEHVTSAELGTEWALFAAPVPPPPPTVSADGIQQLAAYPQPDPKWRLNLGATAFWNDFRDAVGNVTIARGPGTFPIVGALGAGALGRQRLNLDRTRVQGLELSAAWFTGYSFSLTADATFNDATVQRATLAPGLVGRRVAQVPRHSASLGAIWRPTIKTVLTPRIRWMGRQFEDDENQLVLGEVVVADVSVSHRLSNHFDVSVTIENLGNARIETGRSADGVVNVGTPRLAVFGLRGSW